ncbi:PKD domain-containing protein [Kangiella shandongensis]|uniref:PKD domain-containing protein n=1 Tax=Kangiella shandongensis TaxID=2763258 RepID=UPI001CC090D1|nr:PKD domain-containing protein [Kangiella shandongensis]
MFRKLLLTITLAGLTLPALAEDKSPPLLESIKTSAASSVSCTKRDTPRDAQGRVKVGEEVDFTAMNNRYEASQSGLNVAWRQEIRHLGASYIAVHFKRFNLPQGAKLVVRSPDGSRQKAYTGRGKPRFDNREGFWAQHIPGDTAIVEILSQHPIGQGAVAIDSYARGYDKFESGEPNLFEPEALCGTDDSDWAQCYSSTESEAYNKGKAVARLLINGSSACTGWLVGSEGHLMTNNHCIGNASDAANTDYEFMAEGSCGTDCSGWFDCPGTVEADTADLIQTDSALDYSMVKLPTNVSSTYGFLQMRASGAQVGERIYIPQHPGAQGKRIAIESTASGDNGVCQVMSLDEPACTGGDSDVGYMCDTQGGSSGSPVLSYNDNTVVALHHCANCPNRGVPIDDVITDLGSNVPANGVPDGSNIPPTADFSVTISGLTADFTNNSSDSDGSITSHHWDFGDGNTSSTVNPSHTYAASGNYNVTLTVTDDSDATSSKTETITIGGGEELQNGVPVDNLAANTGEWLRYVMTVPEGASNLEFTISGGSGDADLYVKYGSEPTSSSYDCRPYQSGNEETCSFATPQAGTYHVSVHAYSSFSGVSLVGSYDDGSTPPPDFNLTASSYKQKGVIYADLNWTGSSASSFDVFRDGSNIASVSGTSYTDNTGTKGKASFDYQVCEAGTSTCTNVVTVSN